MSLDHHFAEPTAIRTNLGAIFVSLELSRSTWLITSLSPGGGEKMSKHGLSAGNIAALLARLSELKQKAFARTGQSFQVIVIQEAGLDGFWIHRVLQSEGIESHAADRTRLGCHALALHPGGRAFPWERRRHSPLTARITVRLRQLGVPTCSDVAIAQKAIIGCWAKPIQPAYRVNCSDLDAF